MIYMRVPRDRLGALIGKDGCTKALIEEETKCVLEIDSDSGDVAIIEGDDPEGVLKAKDVVAAIAHGFSPERAALLFRSRYYLQMLEMRDYVKKDPKHMRRVRGRIIGTRGKTRALIEQLSGAEVSVSAHTIGIIGDILSLEIAREAVEMLLKGSEHATVYRYLERRRREIKAAEIEMA
ncbi:MAG: KH domain-containing protein [Candidatus Thermoplasmatota archaeon]